MCEQFHEVGIDGSAARLRRIWPPDRYELIETPRSFWICPTVPVAVTQRRLAGQPVTFSPPLPSQALTLATSDVDGEKLAWNCAGVR